MKMSENIIYSRAVAKLLKNIDKNVQKGRYKLFLDADLKPELKGPFKHHIHLDWIVPWQIIRHWKRRGFRPVKRSVAHVRFEGNEKKYVYPAYFLTPKKVKE